MKETIEPMEIDEGITKSENEISAKRQTKKRRRSVFEVSEGDSSASFPEPSMTESKRPRRETKTPVKYAEMEEFDSSSSEKEEVINLR